MVDKGNVDKHRLSISGSGLGRVVESEKWGREAAIKRTQGYGPLKYRDGAPMPPDRSMPQFKATDGRGPDWADDHPNDWVRGGGANRAEGKPNFDKGIRRPGKV